jgi:hypothetical protein
MAGMDRVEIKICLHDGVFIKNPNTSRWTTWSPNGEYWEDACGDDLTDAEVSDWPRGASI